MSAISGWVCAIAFLALLSAGQSEPSVLEFTPKKANGFDAALPTGFCLIRLRVDQQANIYIHHETVRVESPPGKPAKDEGSECSQYLPESGIASFQFGGVSGRGDVQLVEEPTPGNSWRVWIRIRDRKNGAQAYTFRVSWKNSEAASPPAAVGRAAVKMEIRKGGRAVDGSGLENRQR